MLSALQCMTGHSPCSSCCKFTPFAYVSFTGCRTAKILVMEVLVGILVSMTYAAHLSVRLSSLHGVLFCDIFSSCLLLIWDLFFHRYFIVASALLRHATLC